MDTKLPQLRFAAPAVPGVAPRSDDRRFSGTAVAVAKGDLFEQALAIARQNGITTARERIRSIVVIAVTDASPLISPAHDSGATETDIARLWLVRIIDRFHNLRA